MARSTTKAKSSCIASYEYDRKNKTLTIDFVKGGSHAYQSVPAKVVSGLAKASSQGQYFNQFIRNSY